MPSRSQLSAILGLLFSGMLSLTVAAQAPTEAEAETEDDEAEDLRDRLTEREDENRLEDPWSIEVRGRPLIISGEYEVTLDFLDELVLGDEDEDYDSLLIEQQLETELFYSLGRQLSIFAQFRLATEHDLHHSNPQRVADGFVERGEMWLYSEDIAGSGLSFEIGRLDFEDDRLWWWDEDLDALRMTYEKAVFELALAVAYELAPRRTDANYIEPEDHKVLRYFGEASWDWAPDHEVQLFGLISRDRSYTPTIDQVVHPDRADESDADLDWFGLRASGAWQAQALGLIGYWLDYAEVSGDELLAVYEEESLTESVVEELTQHRVRGWAVDAGMTWILPLRAEPRFSVGYAIGSGDRNLDDDIDRSFHQTGLHGNETAFGGVERFDHYGVLLDPELSNLTILTLGAGLSLFNSSSLDLVYNRYRMRTPAETLRDARIEIELTGENRSLGDALDLVFALEENPRFQFEATLSAFRPGAAFGPGYDQCLWGGLVAMRIAF